MTRRRPRGDLDGDELDDLVDAVDAEPARRAPTEYGAELADPGERHDEAAAPAGLACFWCRVGFKRRSDGGKAQRFCSLRCRRAFDGAARAWVRQAVEAGTLSLETLRKASPATRALLTEANGTPEVVG
jgi:hypothetical protein